MPRLTRSQRIRVLNKSKKQARPAPVLKHWPGASKKAPPAWLPSPKAYRKRSGARRSPAGPRDSRPVCVIVHHVASVYPIEVELARTIGSGKAVTDVTWEVVAQLNGKHAQEQAGITKAAALELLRKNSQEAAAAIRAFTDDELDQAAPFGLSYGAPVTAQFVIEDHALRHSWHHLAGIRRALGR